MKSIRSLVQDWYPASCLLEKELICKSPKDTFHSGLKAKYTTQANPKTILIVIMLQDDDPTHRDSLNSTADVPDFKQTCLVTQHPCALGLQHRDYTSIQQVLLLQMYLTCWQSETGTKIPPRSHFYHIPVSLLRPENWRGFL